MKEIENYQISSSITNSSGFTIIEIISVLIIIGILSAVVVPRITSTGVYNVVMEIETLKNHLRYAQSRAMSHNELWGISITANSYTLQKNGLPAPVNLPNDDSTTHTLANGVSISSANQVISFNDLGSPGNSDIVITFNSPAGSSPGCSSSGAQQTGNYRIMITGETGFIQ